MRMAKPARHRLYILEQILNVTPFGNYIHYDPKNLPEHNCAILLATQRSFFSHVGRLMKWLDTHRPGAAEYCFECAKWYLNSRIGTLTALNILTNSIYSAVASAILTVIYSSGRTVRLCARTQRVTEGLNNRTQISPESSPIPRIRELLNESAKTTITNTFGCLAGVLGGVRRKPLFKYGFCVQICSRLRHPLSLSLFGSLSRQIAVPCTQRLGMRVTERHAFLFKLSIVCLSQPKSNLQLGYFLHLVETLPYLHINWQLQNNGHTVLYAAVKSSGRCAEWEIVWADCREAVGRAVQVWGREEINKQTDTSSGKASQYMKSRQDEHHGLSLCTLYPVACSLAGLSTIALILARGKAVKVSKRHQVTKLQKSVAWCVQWKERPIALPLSSGFKFTGHSPAQPRLSNTHITSHQDWKPQGQEDSNKLNKPIARYHTHTSS
ncbi:uncharacterized protein BDR25DRAFT_360436 [Lindgomyces ingoldianus]|uniref:Uncharacterized protein n=1 Tax=Lindgomyces ingoldianus TaxID=673940 RepID=A0ACB6QGI9_9PLEO|nr:uncharacterized protein BDR25DRAFT_360436 [Lindgomyces ingoldianus]KAF2465477.1 hypothetical protein BDR25DRAFT_360436 [Lindgomyces ingoldianus]